ncbi:hypothetical protein ANO11243_056190 [Dothideomycetidae sp. 11243]|nr:hypothetical protein ANO11243_056190 [fungal sp. No.11243]
MSKSGRGESVENDAAHSAPTLHDYLKAIDKTEERAQLFADGCNSLVPIPSDHFLGPSNNDSDVQHLFGQYIRALRERCEDVNGKGKAWLSGIDQVAVARRCVLKHSSTVQGLGTLYDSIPSWPGASPGVGCGVELNGGVQAPCCAEDFKDMLAKPFSIIVVLGETEICSSPSFNRQYDHKSFVQRRSYDVVDSAKEDLSDATHPITHKRFKEILVEPLTKAIMGPSEHRSASAAAEGRSWNFLGIGSNTIFPVPEAVKQVDLLEEILQKINKDPSISVADPDELAAIQSHVEVMRKGFFFAATPGAVSPFHKDKAGLCTMILPQVGVKEWFIPSTDAVEDVTTERLPMPERVAGIRFKPGTLLIQSAGVSHAVYSPELCLAFGRFFYHKFHFARSIDAVRDQILDKTTENETMTATDYLLFTFAIRAMGLVDLRPERLQQQVKAIGDLLEAVGAGLEVGAVDVVSKMAQYMSKNKPITAPCLNACPPWARKLIIEQEKNRKEGRSQRQWSCAQAAHLVRLVRYAQLFYQTNVSTATAGPSTAITRNNSTKRKRA